MTRLSPTRIILASVLYLLLLAGTYTYAVMTLNAQKWGLIGVAAILVATIMIIIAVVVLKKKNRLNRVLKPILILSALGVVLFNAYLLNSSYFVPHQTTTVLNRYFPVSLETSVKLQEYLTDKTLLVDPSVNYFDRDYDELSPIANSHNASVRSSVKEIKTLEEPYGFVKGDALEYLKSRTDEYEMIDWNYYREINAYFFYDILDSDEVVVIWGRQMSTFFITPEILAELREMQ
ncbi:MAG: hypothetical protein AB1Z19_07235 [Eubacteriales bacterium]